MLPPTSPPPKPPEHKNPPPHYKNLPRFQTGPPTPLRGASPGPSQTRAKGGPAPTLQSRKDQPEKTPHVMCVERTIKL